MKCEKCKGTDLVEHDAASLICPECGAQRQKVESDAEPTLLPPVVEPEVIVTMDEMDVADATRDADNADLASDET